MKYPPILPKFYEEEPTAFKRLIQAQLSRKDLKDSLNLIPSPSSSVKIQIMGKKVCLCCKGKTLLGVANQLFTEGDGIKSRLSS